MTGVAKAIVAVGFVAIGMWGLHLDVQHSGWLVFWGVVIAL